MEMSRLNLKSMEMKKINANEKQKIKQIWDDAYAEKNESDRELIWNRLNQILWNKMQGSVDSMGIILEAGCGMSVLMNNFTEKANAVGIDISSIALKKARKIFKSPILIQGDINQLPFRDESFDLVYNIGVIEHFLNPNLPLREMRRVTKLSGTIIVAVPNKYNLWTLGRVFVNFLHGLHLLHPWKYGYEKSYSKSELQKLLTSLGFEKTHVSGCGTFEGVYITAYFSFRRLAVIVKLLYPLLDNETTSLRGKILNRFAEAAEKLDMFGILIVARSIRREV